MFFTWRGMPVSSKSNPWEKKYLVGGSRGLGKRPHFPHFFPARFPKILVVNAIRIIGNLNEFAMRGGVEPSVEGELYNIRPVPELVWSIAQNLLVFFQDKKLKICIISIIKPAVYQEYCSLVVPSYGNCVTD